MKLYFSHEIGDCLAFRGKEGHAKALLTNPMAEYIVTDNDAVWFNRGKDRVVIDEIDEKYKILAIRNRRLVPKIRGKYRFHLVGVESPTEIWNLKPDSAEIMPNTEFYVLPNGRAYYHGIKVQSWTRKWGKDKLEFNRRSFLEAKRMAEDGEYTAKKPKGKKKNKFFDPKVVEGLKESKKSNLPGILATKDKSIVASGMNLCDDCRYNTVCPGFAAGSVCKYSETFKYLIPKIKSRDVGLITEVIEELISNESERYAMCRHLERITGTIDGSTTQIGDLLFKKLAEYIKLVKPILDSHATYNILNQQINVSIAVEKLEDAGLSEQQRQGLAEEIESILKEERQKGAGGA